MIVEKKGTDKKDSDNPDYNDTERWKNTQTVIKLETKNGGRSTIDELPGGIVQQRIVAREELIQNSKLQSAKSASSSSEISISSQLSSEENHNVQQKPKKSQIPVRSNSSASSSSNNSSLKGSSLFKRESLKDNKENWYKINEAESWILISPDLLDLVKTEKLIKETDSREANALTYRETDKVRLMRLTKKEILILKENIPRLCERLKANEKINIFRN